MKRYSQSEISAVKVGEKRISFWEADKTDKEYTLK